MVRRVSALVLVGPMIPSTLAAHSFWTVKDPAARKQQQTGDRRERAMTSLKHARPGHADQPGHPGKQEHLKAEPLVKPESTPSCQEEDHEYR